ncbi:NADH-quinone oxidoreductase subunit K [Pseudomonadota bacterium]
MINILYVLIILLFIFSAGLFGVFYHKKNLLRVLLSIKIMMGSVILALTFISIYCQDKSHLIPIFFIYIMQISLIFVIVLLSLAYHKIECVSRKITS